MKRIFCFTILFQKKIFEIHLLSISSWINWPAFFFFFLPSDMGLKPVLPDQYYHHHHHRGLFSLILVYCAKRQPQKQRGKKNKKRKWNLLSFLLLAECARSVPNIRWLVLLLPLKEGKRRRRIACQNQVYSWDNKKNNNNSFKRVTLKFKFLFSLLWNN